MAFERAEAECAFGMPNAAALLQLAGIMPKQPRDAASSRQADEAWQFVTSYVTLHGSDGHTRMVSTGEGCYKSIPAPEIPKAIRGALSSIGLGVTGGLLRIQVTRASEMGFLRKDFDQAYSRQFESSGLELVKA